MSDTVKLFITISKDQYEICKNVLNGVNRNSPITECEFAIATGTPLEELKAEIEKLNPVDYGLMFSYESHNGARDIKRDILDILDNIGEESEKTE